MPHTRGEASPERWSQLMRQALDAAAEHNASSSAASSSTSAVDDVVALATRALDRHVGRTHRIRQTAEQWGREARLPAQLSILGQTSPPTPFLGARPTTPFRAGRAVDRKG